MLSQSIRCWGDRIRELIKKFIASRFAIFGGVSLFPLIFFWPVLGPNSWLRIGDSPADVDHAIFEVVGLKTMRFPWSKNVALNWPTGENFWSVPSHVTQSIQWLAMWAIGKFADPVLTVNLWMFVGFVSTGVVVYLICRRVQVSRPLALCGALLVQCLPWMSIKTMHHTSFVFLSIPLVTVYGLLSLSSPKSKAFLFLAGYQLVLALFDPYWFVFSGLILFFGLALNLGLITKSVSQIGRRRLIFVLAGSLSAIAGILFLAKWGLSAVNSGSLTRMSNTRNVFEPEEIERWTGRFRDYLVPSHGHIFYNDATYIEGESDRIFYGSVIVQVLALCATFVAIRRSRTRGVGLIALIAVFATVLSTRPISVGGISSPPVAELISRVTPGIRVFVRFSPIAQALACILFVWFIQTSMLQGGKRRGPILATLILLVALIDLNPLGYRPVFRDYEKYAEMRSIIDASAVRQVLIPDGSLAPLELSMETFPAALNARLLNTYSNYWRARIAPEAWSSQSLANFLSSNGVSYVAAVVDFNGEPFIAGEIQDATRFATRLDRSDFQQVSRLISTESGAVLALFRVLDRDSNGTCGNCSLAQWKVNPQPLVESRFDYVSSVNNPLWITSQRLEILPEVIPDFGIQEPDEYLVDFYATLFDGASPTSMTVTVGGNTQVVGLQSNIPRLVQLKVMPGEHIEIQIAGCFIPSENDATSSNSQSYCMGIRGFRVVAVEK
jgi:hypothetical protein